MKTVTKAMSAKRRAKLVAMVEALPEGSVEGDNHLSLFVKGKRFGYYLNDHHGDGIIALTCKAPPGVNRELAEQEPDRFYIPAYVGPKGWLAVRLDLVAIDWDEIDEILVEAYRMTAPKKLIAELDR